MEDNSMSKLLIIVLAVLIVILFILCVAYVIVRVKAYMNSKDSQKKENLLKDKNSSKKGTKNEKTSKANNNFIKQSVFDFMEFDNIQDNMIVQKKGKRYLLVVECQGVNYDLMSQLEKVAVEEGFQQFLNTLRYPIQIYIQTRTMNLEKSIQTYKERVKVVEDRYNQMHREYVHIRNSDAYDEKEKNKFLFELTKNRNLLEYGKDIIANTERMSLNQNVLAKKYYIIIPHYVEDEEKYSIEEIRNMAFSELYTKAQAIITTLAGCSVSGKILSSNELVELLYMAYNREEADIYGLEKALRAEYDNLYSTGPDVFEKKIKALNEEIRERAIDLANSKIEQVKSRPQKKAEEIEDSMDELVRKMAKIVLEENKSYVGKETAEQAIAELEKEEEIDEQEEGGNVNVQIKKKTRRTRSN